MQISWNIASFNNWYV